MRTILLLLFTLPLKIWAAEEPKSSYIMVLGIAQDGGYPHMGCQKNCCKMAWKDACLKKNIVSLALIDPVNKKWWLFEATPDIKQQLQDFRQNTREKYPYLPEGIFITHAHIGHYTGLMEFGKEVMAANRLKVFVLPKLKAFIEQNGPWSQLVKLGNIKLISLEENTPINIEKNKVIAFRVPHRDEYSETAGFKILTAAKKYLFIPDIDKWNKWDKSIIDEVKGVNIALLDATFNTNTELGNRPISEVLHPFVMETKNLFINESPITKSKVYFIHFNHTNPLLWNFKSRKQLLKQGFNLAYQGQIF